MRKNWMIPTSISNGRYAGRRREGRSNEASLTLRASWAGSLYAECRYGDAETARDDREVALGAVVKDCDSVVGGRARLAAPRRPPARKLEVAT